MSRKNVSSGGIWEELVGYSRAVRVGNLIEVAGTTAITEAGEIVGPGDAYAQTKFILEKISKTLQGLDATMQHVIRTRIYVTHIKDWEQVGKAHGEFFSVIRPASTLVEVSALVKTGLLVEIEATAMI